MSGSRDPQRARRHIFKISNGCCNQVERSHAAILSSALATARPVVVLAGGCCDRCFLRHSPLLRLACRGCGRPLALRRCAHLGAVGMLRPGVHLHVAQEVPGQELEGQPGALGAIDTFRFEERELFP